MSSLAIIEKSHKQMAKMMSREMSGMDKMLAAFVLEGQMELEAETRERERLKMEAERIRQAQLQKAADLAQALMAGLAQLKDMPLSRLEFSLREESSRLVIRTNIPLKERDALLDHSNRRMEASIPRDGTERLRLGVDPFYTDESEKEMDDSLLFEGAKAVPEALAVIARYAGKKGIIARGNGSS
jgi:hypothetical protein